MEVIPSRVNTHEVLLTGSDIRATIRQPLSDDSESKRSDHAVVLLSTLLQNRHAFRKRTVTYRKYSEEGKEKFGRMLVEIDWTEEFKNINEDPSSLA